MSTKESFIAGYAERSGMDRSYILANRVALPCFCGEPICDGWAMVPNNISDVADHLRVYGNE